MTAADGGQRDRVHADPTKSETVIAGHRGDVATVVRAARATDPAVRSAALGAMLRVGILDPTAMERFLGDEAAPVRRRAAEIAPRLPEPCAVERQLARLLGDEGDIAERAAFALGEIGSTGGCELDPATIDLLEEMAGAHEDALCREAAVAALGALHTGLATILAACRDRATVRRRAVIALAPFDGPEVDAALRAALDDRDWQVRQAAEDLLADPDGAGA